MRVPTEKLLISCLVLFAVNLVMTLVLSLQIQHRDDELDEFRVTVKEMQEAVEEINARTSIKELQQIFEQVQEIYEVIVEGA